MECAHLHLDDLRKLEKEQEHSQNEYYESLSVGEAYGISYFDGGNSSEVFGKVPSCSPSSLSRPLSSSRSPMLGFSPLCDSDVTKLPGYVLQVISSGFTQLTKWQREQLVNNLFRQWLDVDIQRNMSSRFVPLDFLPLLGKAMSIVFADNKDNLFYHAAM